jgi:type II secretory pathway predicted ATPase ExeA
MYYRHFGLDGAPFRFVPGGRDLFLGRAHREALAALEWGVLHEPSGFTLLIGEAGTGKTTLVKSILARNYAQVRAACISNPKRGFEGILRELVRQFGLAAQLSKLEMLVAFDQFLERLQPTERIVILIDEAQTLDNESLEELRLFSNGGSAEEKQLHLVLVGQPELIHRLMRQELRQFNDRIGARAVLNPLSAAEARAYLDFRLKAHGSSSNQIFEPAAVDHIVRHSGGIPRRINVLGHNSMLLAYSAGKRKVDFGSARAAAAEYENLLGTDEKRGQKRSAAFGWRRIGLAAAAIAGLLGMILIETGVADGPGNRGVGYATETAPRAQISAQPIGLKPANPRPTDAGTSGTGVESLNNAPGPVPGHDEEAAMHATAGGAATGRPQYREIRVRAGDTLHRLAIRYLGSKERLQGLIAANPQLRNYNLLYPGETVYLPYSGSQE